ncbi:hypothetical protein ASE95_06805 [Sphingomonas sp. Leaf231]|uniref:YceD family protein n=1 Tax=Sphingomonas sp. Leaf231 TaxID=1736301 RepID=UPI0007014C73|nr:DUF177 domain-containing protein [Sphingomonas sp. Leaf231]KQN92437.1 hypothetical protein ASE95_06805 [Sphingomonas sp. Leaf231]
MTTEFARVERLDTIGEEERRVAIEANDTERDALARRFELLAVERLGAEFTIRREAGGVTARGRVDAVVVQACSVTGTPLRQTVGEDVALRFVEPAVGGGEEEIELAGDALDTIEIEGGGIDLGEAAAETMALCLDPFPRSPEAETVLKRSGVLSEEEAGAFGALAGLKAQMEGKA